MKQNLLLISVTCLASASCFITAHAQDVSVVEESATIVTEVSCKTHYYSTAADNWFIQIGAGINSPFMENHSADGKEKHHITVGYNFAFGKWMSPYVGWRLSFLGGPLHWDNNGFEKANYVSGNFDIMWDMFNSFHGVNSRRVFSIVPFVGLGGTFTWDYTPNHSNITDYDGNRKSNSWTLPVSAGIQLRFRLCKYVDFFAEGRAQFHGDNFNNYAYGRPVDVNISAMGGFSFNIGGADFRNYNPCDYLSYINNLNNQVNDLRGALATTAAALAAAESQLPCPEVTEVVTAVEEGPEIPLMATVRFTIGSERITEREMVNIYNIAEWMKANPEQEVAIAGYADRDTGSSKYNMALSKRRAQAVYNILVNKYGVNPDRLTIQAEGSDTQLYDVNDWNRIVIFNIAE